MVTSKKYRKYLSKTRDNAIDLGQIINRGFTGEKMVSS
jgi:hypothetical protein